MTSIQDKVPVDHPAFAEHEKDVRARIARLMAAGGTRSPMSLA